MKLLDSYVELYKITDQQDFYGNYYVRDINMLVKLGYGPVTFVELDGNHVEFRFDRKGPGQHYGLSSRYPGVLRDCFKDHDISNVLSQLQEMYISLKRRHKHDIGIYMEINETPIAHKIRSREYLLTRSLVDTELFDVNIETYNKAIFSPFKQMNKVNLNNPLSSSDIINAILAGQVGKVVCVQFTEYSGGIEHLASKNEDKLGEWDALDLALLISSYPPSFHVVKQKNSAIVEKICYICAYVFFVEFI